MARADAKSCVMDAAAHVFAEMGVARASLDDVARYLGATKGKIYHHFRSKGDLVTALRKQSVQLTLDHVLPVYQSNMDPAEKFHQMADAHVQAIINGLDYHRVVVASMWVRDLPKPTELEKNREVEIRALQSQYEAMFKDVLTAGISTGDFLDQDVSIATHSLLMLLNSPAHWYSPRTDQSEVERFAIATQLANMAKASIIKREDDQAQMLELHSRHIQ